MNETRNLFGCLHTFFDGLLAEFRLSRHQDANQLGEECARKHVIIVQGILG